MKVGFAARLKGACFGFLAPASSEGGQAGRFQAIDAGEDFQKAKRNVLFWSSVAVLFSLSRTNGDVAPPGYSDIKISPVILSTALLLAVLYHLYGFWTEKRKVIGRHSNIVLDKSESVEQAIANEIAAHTALLEKITIAIDDQSQSFAHYVGTARTLEVEATRWIGHIKGTLGITKNVTEANLDPNRPSIPREPQSLIWFQDNRFSFNEKPLNDLLAENIFTRVAGDLETRHRQLVQLAASPREKFEEVLKEVQRQRNDLLSLSSAINARGKLDFYFYDVAVPISLSIVSCALLMARMASQSFLVVIQGINYPLIFT